MVEKKIVHQSNKVVEAMGKSNSLLHYAHGKMCGTGEHGW